jgi:hypothetical protein
MTAEAASERMIAAAAATNSQLRSALVIRHPA